MFEKGLEEFRRSATRGVVLPLYAPALGILVLHDFIAFVNGSHHTLHALQLLSL